jgi:hypothetical protein
VWRAKRAVLFMRKIVRVHDPNEIRRRLPLTILEDDCPGLLEFFSTLEYRTDGPLVRAVFYQWFIRHSSAGTLAEAVSEALSGPGGVRDGTISRKRPALTSHRVSAEVRQAKPMPLAMPAKMELEKTVSTFDLPNEASPDQIRSLSLYDDMF